jgi:hypothetical protein
MVLINSEVKLLNGFQKMNLKLIDTCNFFEQKDQKLIGFFNNHNNHNILF